MALRLVVTIAIVLALIAVLMPYLPFKALLSKLDYSSAKPFQENFAPGDVGFVLKADAYDSFGFLSVNRNITVFMATGYAQNVEIAAENDMQLEGYSGNVVVGSKTVFNGSLTKIIVPGLKVKTNSIYLEAGGFYAQNIASGSLHFNNVSGIVIVKGAETKFSGTLAITDAAFDISVKNSTLNISGKARMIEMPSTGLRFA